MGTVLSLTLRQIGGARRLLIIGLLALLPAALALLLRRAGGDGADPGGVIDALLVGVVLPIITLAPATRSFGNEVEDRTLGFIAATPTPKWQIALAKLLAPVLIAVPLALISGAAATAVSVAGGAGGSAGAANTVAAVCAGLLAGALAYAAVFTWAGLMTTRALPFALIYVFLWEGLVSALIPGVRYLSIRAYTLSVMHAADPVGLDRLADQVVALPVALAGAGLALAGFWLLTLLRLRRMDLP